MFFFFFFFFFNDTATTEIYTLSLHDALPISLAAQHGDGFAVILTGAGADGAIGVRAVKETGGIILVQDPIEAEYPSMPRAAIATGIADFVLPVRELADRIVELIRTHDSIS